MPRTLLDWVYDAPDTELVLLYTEKEVKELLKKVLRFSRLKNEELIELKVTDMLMELN